MGLTMRYRDFDTIQNIEEEDEEKNELIKSITNPLEGQIENDEITLSKYAIDDNNVGIPINVRTDINNIVEDIINNTT